MTSLSSSPRAISAAELVTSFVERQEQHTAFLRDLDTRVMDLEEGHAVIQVIQEQLQAEQVRCQQERRQLQAEQEGLAQTLTQTTATQKAVVVPSKSLTHPCRNPACLTVMDQARAYVRSKLGERYLPSYAALGQTEAYQACRMALAESMLAGDVDATKAACRTWCKLVIGWTRQHPYPGTNVSSPD